MNSIQAALDEAVRKRDARTRLAAQGWVKFVAECREEMVRQLREGTEVVYFQLTGNHVHIMRDPAAVDRLVHDCWGHDNSKKRVFTLTQAQGNYYITVNFDELVEVARCYVGSGPQASLDDLWAEWIRETITACPTDKGVHKTDFFISWNTFVYDKLAHGCAIPPEAYLKRGVFEERLDKMQYPETTSSGRKMYLGMQLRLRNRIPVLVHPAKRAKSS